MVVTVEHVISIISAMRLHEGGAAMLAAHMINHIIDIEGMAILSPLFIKSLRELDIEYDISAEANKADLNSPWEIIIAIAPQIPHGIFARIPAITSLICPTDEYAIRDLISCCRVQIRLVIIPPHKVSLNK